MWSFLAVRTPLLGLAEIYLKQTTPVYNIVMGKCDRSVDAERLIKASLASGLK
jgi:hypothetical protein